MAVAGVMLSTNATAQEATGTVIASSNDINHVYITTTRVHDGGKTSVPGHEWVKDMNVVSEDDWFRIKPNRLDDTTPWQLVREKGKTVLHLYLSKESWLYDKHYLMHSGGGAELIGDTLKGFWIGGDQTAIVDMETGIHYKPRGTYDKRLWNTHICLAGAKDLVLDFAVEFPELPESTKLIKIHGIPRWNLMGDTAIPLTEDAALKYDKKPTFHIPHLVEAKQGYDPDDISTYDIYTGAQTILPCEADNSMAIWRTKDATYLAIAYELNWNQEYFRFSDNITLTDQTTGLEYKIHNVLGVPFNRLFMLKGNAGDWVAFLMEFPPLPLSTYKLTYHEPKGESFSAWGADWSEKRIYGMSVQELKDNQKMFEYLEPKTVE